MRHFRSVLALVAAIGCGASAFAQYNDDSGGATGSICQPGYDCSMPADNNGNGNGAIDPSPYDPQPGRPGRPGYPGQPNRGDHREVYVGQYFRDQSLDLTRLLNLSSARGSTVDSVEVTIQVGNGSAQLQLIADGYMEDTQGTYSSFVGLQPRRNLIIGQTLRMLSLGVRGKVYIERIAVNLGGGYSPNPPPYPGPNPYPPGNNEVVATGYIGQTFYSPGNIDITQQTALMNYRGYRVVSVTVYGQSLNYQGGIRVLANGMIIGNLVLDGYGNGKTVYPPMQLVVGQNLSGLNILIDNQARIDRVEVRLRR